MNKIRKYLFSILLVFSFVFCFGQQNGSDVGCISADPICSSSELSFENTSSSLTAEAGPDYGCLSTQPYPAWFFLKIGESGDVELNIEQSSTLNGVPNLDVDFILYGPFVDVLDACDSGLTSLNIIDCSYSPSETEIANIDNAILGEYYLLLITNYSGQFGYITVNQSAGAGATDCSILEEIEACEGDLLALDAQTTDADSFLWYQDDVLNPGSLLLIAGENEEVYFATTSNTYVAEVFDISGNLIKTITYEVLFLEKPVISNAIDPYVICDNFEENDGVGEFELHLWDDEILNGLDANSFSVSYFSNEIDAHAMENPLPNFYVNDLPNETIVVRIDNTSSSATACYVIGTLDLEVIQKPQVSLEDYYICTFTNGTEEITNPIIETGLSAVDFSFEWTESSDPNTILSTNSFFAPTIAGIYNVLVTDNNTTCSTEIGDPGTISIITEGSPPVDFTAEVITNTFAGNHVIEANIVSDNDTVFEFSLDNGVFVNNGTNTFLFKDVLPGNHIITARDINGCGKATISVLVVGYPLLFTPNNDGYNDTWQIVGIGELLDAKISVFDRYGKLLKELSPGSKGWDGTFKGNPLPPNDYWFSIAYKVDNYVEGKSQKEFTAHFSLKR
ncbi:T9SS type B sorting domain-containing protein [Lacinutrix sp. WUR7]|uniref:T9SS type B sorting domain-containing protein n=1 Tax=Lacinutrix sp. WUR7 TaxID=2653681 RepID=UPI001EF00B01|nr:T9SS type B sorting domain-containing protein [Lacinutrix sp. WUR7]